MSTSITTTRRWIVDGVDFSVDILWGVKIVSGRFDRVAGSYETGPNGAKLELWVATGSIDTGNAGLDQQVRSNDYVLQHPEVRLLSTDVHDAGDGELHVVGRLETAGRVQPVEFDAVVRETDRGLRIDAATTVDQKQFGMSGPPATLRVTARLAAQ
jgi:polyisoprenoid-binding protein YceI